jgi:hypothetical protein
VTRGDGRNIGLASHIARHISDVIVSKGYNIQQNGAFTEAKGGAIRTDFIGQEILQVLLSRLLFSDRREVLSW